MRVPVPAAEVHVDTRLVRHLLRTQFPDLAELPLRRVGSGWDTVVIRVGRDLVVRVPRRELGAVLIESELRWLPELAPRLPLPVPVPLRAGSPTDQYPWRWSVCRYLPGRPLGADRLVGRDGLRAADSLAEFLAALHRPAPADAPRHGIRGVPLAHRAERFLECLPAVPSGMVSEVRREWDALVAVPAHAGPDLWLHGDLHPLNVLVRRGRISGVIDFGDLSAGDPATDLACAWLLLDAPARQRLRAELGVDDDRWQRGRGWALFLSVMFLVHSAESATKERMGMTGLAEVLADRD